jgi:RNA polymerase sigma factor for flagellar operon FliA
MRTTAKSKPRSAARDALWRRYQRRPTEALRNQLAERYLPLVEYHVARLGRQLPPHVDLDDLAAAGAIGLLQAIEGFDPERGYKFATYAALRIRGAALDELRAQDHLSRKVRERATRLAKAARACEVRLGRPPSPDEVAADLGLSLVEFAELARQARTPGQVSLHAPRYDAVEDKCVDYRETVSDPLAGLPTRGHERREAWEALTRGCNQRERLLLIGLYQLGQTMRVVGRTLGLSESRVSQMHSQVLARLREAGGIAT